MPSSPSELVTQANRFERSLGAQQRTSIAIGLRDCLVTFGGLEMYSCVVDAEEEKVRVEVLYSLNDQGASERWRNVALMELHKLNQGQGYELVTSARDMMIGGSLRQVLEFRLVTSGDVDSMIRSFSAAYLEAVRLYGEAVASEIVPSQEAVVPPKSSAPVQINNRTQPVGGIEAQERRSGIIESGKLMQGDRRGKCRFRAALGRENPRPINRTDNVIKTDW